MRQLVLIFLACSFAAASADERILSFHSDIDVAADASMIVTETIRVRAERNQIRRGIFRDFPTRYTDRLGNRYRVAFEPLSVTRDGESERWRSERHANGVRVYIGHPNRFLDPGVYTYVLRYSTDRQLGFRAEHDELFWNVTGNGWAFPIDQASAEVRLPASVPGSEIGIEGYTGVYGSRDRDYASNVRGGTAFIRTTSTLGRYEGLTTVVTWPKGHVAEPTRIVRLRWLLADNRELLLGLVGLLGSAIYLGWVWSRYGRDPDPGVIFPQYEPPSGYSPASARFISRMSYDDTALTAGVINLAVKGHLVIDKRDDDYILTKSNSQAALAPGEAALLRALFSGSSILALDDANYRDVQRARKAHRRSLRRNYEKVYFFTNSPLLLPSILFSILVGATVWFTGVVTPAVAIVFGLNALMHVALYVLMRAPTPRGRTLMDKLEGFKLYLDVAEKDDLNLRNPPQKTPELFERYLPFALALDVEQAWARQFDGVFTRLAAERGEKYEPDWYRGRFRSSELGEFTSSVGRSLSTAISSAASPPGSSSGGGGFSGGGGGGGGGGGW